MKNLFYKFLALIDDGRFLIKPMKWWYYFKGVIPFLLPIGFIILVANDKFLRADRALYFTSGWGKP